VEGMGGECKVEVRLDHSQVHGVATVLHAGRRMGV